jgi:hypothetical protein
MSILTKVLIGLVVVAVFPLFYFTAAALKVQHSWRNTVDDYFQAVAAQEKANFEKLHGDEKARLVKYDPSRPAVGSPGLLQLQTARDNLKHGRGRLWYARRDASLIDTNTGTLKVQILDENVESQNRLPLKEHGIKDKSFVYLFQLAHNQMAPGGNPAADDRYIGEFIVSGLSVDANTGLPSDHLLPLRPALPLTTAEWDEIKQGSGDWIIYEHMPIDDHHLFSGLDEQQIRDRLPDSVENEYVFDNKPPSDAVLADPKLAAMIVEDKDTGAKKFLRPLRDYQQAYRQVAVRLAEINDRLVILKKEKEYADAAKVQAEALIASLDARKAKLEADKAVVEAELAVTKAHAEKLQAAVAQVQQELQARLAENRRLGEAISGGKTATVFAPADVAAQTP